ncbi:hypothetical protein PDJAM_G00097680 [Pangasius djambal]|uniref:Uncharacterized protein n=1 Tax=Pangasius djambal TaxID=1691987 RepID=A0ACC5Z7B8_9TELE|nr:hypothetical protein [Pangasius djambal]
MEGDGTEQTVEKERLTEKACLVSTPHSVSVVLKPGKTDECGNNQANQQFTLSPVTLTKSSTQESHTSSDIKVTLENESVWSRFHSLGTEMILTRQGRRMFPCCRFRLSGLDLQRKYFLVMDIMPLDDFTHKWNGKTWEPVAVDEPHVLGQICVHPDSPALGQQWMDSPVSFYKVKLTSDSMDQEGCVLLRPMHRYLPRLHVVPVDPHSERTIALDSPNVKVFTFPQTEFYAVTSYQNPRITQLKIDCNPFAMAFREDSQSIRLLQDKLRLCSSAGTPFRSPFLSLAQNLSGKQKEGAVKSTASTCVQDKRKRDLYPGTTSLKEGEGIFTKMRNATLSCPNNMALCQENTDNSENDGGDEAVVNKCPAEAVLDEHVVPLGFEPSVTVSLEERLPSTVEPVPPISSTENPKSSEASAVNSQISCTNSESPTKSSMAAQSPETHGEIKSAAVSLPRPHSLNGSQVHERKPGCLYRRGHYRRGRKAKSKWWSNVKYAKPPPSVPPLNAPLQPDLEDVEGMLFVSFVAKEALNIHVENIKESETSPPPPSPTHNQPDNHEAAAVSLSMEERIAKLEKILLLHLKQQKHRQVIHPRLQDVGMKLSLLDPKLPIDLQYLGVHLPLPPPILEGLDKMNPMSLSSSPDAAGFFVSRTGKTNDPTKIKGWREKFKTNTVQNAPEGLKNSSAFCSEMLDAYLENEAQQISDRVAVFSKCSTSPVSYQLPSKSSSYVVTLDSLLKSRSVSSNKVCSKPTDKILSKSPLRRSSSAAVPLSSAGFQNRFQGNQEKGSKFARSFQAHQHAVSTVQASRSTSFVSRPGMKKQPGKSQLKWIPVKVKKQMMLQEMEEEAIFHGKVRTHITTERAKFALTSLLNFQKPGKRPRFRKPHKDENACPEDFCRLGCMCDSLDREIRGPTHCRRVECMFDCNCFKHKVLLLHPPKETANVQRGRKRSVLAFPIADPEREPRPPPAPSITTLWKRVTGEHDPEPLFIPEPSLSSKTVSRLRTSLYHSTSQVWEEDKDPVYLYFESMMTCARVREYNSNPPPQIHMFPTKKQMTEPEQLNEIAEAGEPPSSQKIRETNPPEPPVKPGEPKPTKLLEILSECNWEPHRSLVLSALFRRMNSNLLSESFCFGMYKIQLLSTTVKGVDRSSTITYKVCISRADEKEMTEDLQLPVKKALRNQNLKGCETKVSKANETQAQKATADTDSGRKSSTLVEKQQKKPVYKRVLRALPFLTHAAPVGYLKADKKKPGSPTQGLVKVNGKTYTQAKLLLGQLGALHPVNRFAAFVTGRLLPILREQSKIEVDTTKACPPKAPLEPSPVTEVANVSNQTPSNLAVAIPPLANASEPNTVSKNRRSNISPLNALSNLVGPSPGTTPIVPDGSRFVLVPVTPSNSAAAPSAETVTSSTLPPGQQVVLQPAPGMPGSNFLCQYNGQMIQLKPISAGPLVQPQSSSVSEGSTSQVMRTANNTGVPKDTRSVQKPLNSTPLTKMLPNPFPVSAPKVLSLSATSGMSIANGMPAFNLQSSFPGKTGTFSFRICPPTSDGKPVGSEHGGKPPEPSVDSSSTLVLPGGFTLIKLFPPAVSAVSANVTSAACHPAEIPQNDESMKKSILQSCSPNLEQNCQASESITKPLLPETSDLNSAQGPTAGSKGVIKDEPVEQFSESVNTVTPGKYGWVPEGAEMVHTSDVSELEPQDMDDWPPKGAERILWIDSADEEENEDLNKEMNKDLDVAAGSPAAEEAKSFSDSPKTDTCSVHDDVTKQHIGSENNLPLINKEEPSMNQTVTEFSSDLSKKSLGPENSSQILNHKEFYNNPAKPSTMASLHAEDSHENIDVAGNAPCSLLDGQTPVMNSPPAAYLLSTASLGQNTGPKNVFPHKSSPELSDHFKTSKTVKQDFLNEGKDEAEDRNTQLKSKTAGEELCGDEEIVVDVMNLSEDEDPSDEFDRDEDDSSDDGEGDSNSDEEDSSNDSTSDSETSADMSNEDDVDVETFEENDGKKMINMIKDKTRHRRNAMSEAKLRKKVKHLSSIISIAGYLPTHELEKRLIHTEKERVRRDEMRQSFDALKKAINVEERVKMCKDDILNQARLMIRALEDRSQCLEERKNVLLQRQSAYLSKIVELSAKTEARDKASFEENCEQQQRFGSQNTLQTSVLGPLVNPRRLDSDGNRLPPRLGRWKAPNYIRKRSRKALRQPSITTTVAADESADLHLSPDTPGNHTVSGPLPLVKTEDLVRSLIAQNPTGLPPICKTPQQKSLSTEPKPPEKRSLPKIVLQSFGKTDAVKLPHDVRTSLPSSAEVSSSAQLLTDGNLDLQDQNKGMEKCDATRVSNEMEKTLVSEHSNKESPTPSSAVTGSDVQNNTLSELEKDEQASAAVVKVRKRRRKSDVVIEQALSNPDVLGPRQLRKRSPAVNGGATRGGSANKSRRIV